MNRWLALCPALIAAAAEPGFVNVTAKSGLASFRNVQGTATAKPHIMEVMGGGAAFLDYNNDGNLDVLLVRGSTIAAMLKGGGDPVCALYRGDGKGGFKDVTGAAQLDRSKGWGQGVAVADYDNDGWQDIFVTGFGGNFLFRNRGDGTFEDVTKAAGLESKHWSMGAAFADLDRDGDLDLYVANYLEYPLDKLPKRDETCNYRGFPVFCGPRGLPGERDALYVNDGKGRFRNIAAEAGIDNDKLYGLGVLIGDYDNDGLPDIFVATDLAANLFYRNKGKLQFEESAVLAGLAFSEDGIEEGSMGVDFGDLDRDGFLDIYYTNSSYQTNTLLVNNRDGSFTNVSNPAGHGESTYLYVGWGASFGDLDNDGWEDLIVVNGHLYPEADRFEMGLQYKQRALLFRNSGDKTFKEMGEAAQLMERWKGRGLAVGDYDNDGRLDIVVNNLDDGPVLLHNEMNRGNHWLTVHCVGTASNRSAAGARLTLRAGGEQQIREIKAGNSYLSANDLRVHFGLGSVAKVDTLEVRWPSGRVDRMENVAVDRIQTIREGQSAAK